VSRGIFCGNPGRRAKANFVTRDGRKAALTGLAQPTPCKVSGIPTAYIETLLELSES